MQLSTYIQKTNIRQAIIAEKVGVSPATVCRWLKLERFPNSYHMAKIAAVTGGKVTANDFMRQFDEIAQ